VVEERAEFVARPGAVRLLLDQGEDRALRPTKAPAQ
jgi:hypothetical protein